MLSLDKIKKEYDELLSQLSDPELVSDWEKFEQLSKRKKDLDKIIDKDKEIQEIDKRISENKVILNAPDDELGLLAEAEASELQEKKVELEKELEKMLKQGANSKKSFSAIIEIRAGTGGDEATLFAANLYKMYTRFAENKGWKQKLLDSHMIGIGGFKEVIFELKGDVFESMKYEAGVHRVQRIPETEKSGRIHTSTATVAVLPKPKSIEEIKIKSDDLKIDHFRSSGPGGQNVNKRETAVRITHIPTGLVVTSQTERNQLANKENAMAILYARILKKKQEEETSKLGGKRRAQVGGAKRSEKIRTYNFPQDRVTDHRIKKSWHDIEGIMDGNLDKIVKTLQDNLDSE